MITEDTIALAQRLVRDEWLCKHRQDVVRLAAAVAEVAQVVAAARVVAVHWRAQDGVNAAYIDALAEAVLGDHK